MDDVSKNRLFDDAGQDRPVEETTKLYDNWDNYEEVMSPSHYTGPQLVADAVFKYVKNKESHIIDVAAGTGLGGEKLKEYGYMNIDAVEPSGEMAKVAAEKNLYGKFYSEYICEKQTSIKDGQYDHAIVVGGFLPGHIPVDGIRELQRIVKPDGYVIFIVNETYLVEYQPYRDNFQLTVDKMVNENKWKKIEQYFCEKYGSYETKSYRGQVFVYQVC